jgi:hypothetical protein
VACLLKAGISESTRTSIARQWLGNHVSCITVWQTNTYITDHYHGNESLNSGISAVTNTLEAVVSEYRKLKGSTRCSVLSRQRTLLSRWLTKITDI